MITNMFSFIFRFVVAFLSLTIPTLTSIPKRFRILASKNASRKAYANALMCIPLRTMPSVPTDPDFTLTPLDNLVLATYTKIPLYSLRWQNQTIFFFLFLAPFHGILTYVLFGWMPESFGIWPYIGIKLGYKLSGLYYLIITIYMSARAARNNQSVDIDQLILLLKCQFISYFKKDNIDEIEAVRSDFEKNYKKVVLTNNGIFDKELLTAIAPFTKREFLQEIDLSRNRYRNQRKFTFDALMKNTPLPEDIAELVLSYSDVNPIRFMESKPKKSRTLQHQETKENLEAFSHIITMPDEVEFEIDIEDEKEPLLRTLVDKDPKQKRF